MLIRLDKYLLLTGTLLCLLCCVCTILPAQTTANKILYAANRARSDTERINLLLKLSRLYKPDSVVKQFYYASEALAHSQRAVYIEGEMHAEQLIAECYVDVSALDDAINHFKRCMVASRKTGRKDMERLCWQYMVHCYDHTGRKSQALDCQKIMLDLSIATGDKELEINQTSAYANLLSELGKHNEAIYYMRKNIVLAGAYIDKTGISNLYNYLSTFYVRAGHTDTGLTCIMIADSLILNVDEPQSKAYVTSAFCDVYVKAGRYDSAIYYGERTVAMANAIDDVKLEQQYYEILSHTYDSAGKAKDALRCYKMSDSLADIISNKKQTINNAMQVMKVGMEQQAERYKQEQESTSVIRRNQQIALIAALIALLALGVLVVIIYRNLRQKSKTNAIISQQAKHLQYKNEAIDKALQEKEVLLQETHHRVKNNLQLISSLLDLQATEVGNDHAKAALQTAKQRVLSIATVHSKLYHNGETEAIDLSIFVTDLFNSLHSAFGKDLKNVKFDNDIPNNHLRLDTLVPLGLIINELITNSFKYAFGQQTKGIIHIGLEMQPGDGNGYILRYYDNGPGIPDGKWDTNTGSLGLYLIKRLSKQLKGSATYIYKEGSIFTIIFRDGGN